MLLGVCRVLFVVRCVPFAGRCVSFVVFGRCLVFVVCSLVVVRCVMFEYCSWVVAGCVVSVVRCMIAMRCVLFVVYVVVCGLLCVGWRVLFGECCLFVVCWLLFVV